MPSYIFKMVYSTPLDEFQFYNNSNDKGFLINCAIGFSLFKNNSYPFTLTHAAHQLCRNASEVTIITVLQLSQHFRLVKNVIFFKYQR